MKKYFGNAVTLFLITGICAVLLMQGMTSTLLPSESDAPPFDLERHAGGRVSSEALKGKVVLVDFWATWCPPCREEMPWLLALAQEYEGKGVVFLAVSRDEDDERVAAITAYAKKLPALEKYAVYGDPFTAGKYKVRALPTLYVIGKDGKISASVQGSTSEWRVRRWLEAALQK